VALAVEEEEGEPTNVKIHSTLITQKSGVSFLIANTLSCGVRAVGGSSIKKSNASPAPLRRSSLDKGRQEGSMQRYHDSTCICLQLMGDDPPLT
jgi:hypothetical protein